MSIDYSALKTKVGKLVKWERSLATLGTTTLPASLVETLGAYGTSATGTTSAIAPVAGLPQDAAGLMNQVAGFRQLIINYLTNTIVDYDTVVSQLAGVSSPDVQAVLSALVQDMLDQGQSVQKSVVSLGSVTADSSNIGNGTVLLDKVLDGYQAGVAGGLAHIRYMNRDSELAPPSCLHCWRVSADSYGGGVNAGAEPLSWDDGVPFGSFPSFPEGAGSGPGLTGAVGVSPVPAFSTFSSNVPSGWSVTGGTAGTNVLSDSVDYYLGSKSLKLVGDGSTSTISLTYPLAGRLNPRRRYAILAVLKRTGPGSSGVFNASLVGTGYTAGGGEQVNVAVGGLTTSYALYWIPLCAPAALPSDVKFQLAVTNTLDSGTVVNVGYALVVPAVYHAGVAAYFAPGSTPAAVGDKWTATVTNSEGVIQSVFRMLYGAQLPSLLGASSFGGLLLPYALFTSTSPSPTWSDSLAA